MFRDIFAIGVAASREFYSVINILFCLLAFAVSSQNFSAKISKYQDDAPILTTKSTISHSH